MLDAKLLEIIVCPKCKGGLTYQKSELALDCKQCQVRYPIKEGIPILLESDAKPLTAL